MNPRLAGAFGLLVVALLIGGAGDHLSPSMLKLLCSGVAIAGAAVVLWVGGQGGGPSLGALAEAVRAAGRGRRPRIPDSASGELLELYESVSALAEKNSELSEE